MSCSSSRVGVGYEGDTCSFTCNTGYELTGSDNRACQSNGSWSGSDIICRRGNNFMHHCTLYPINVFTYIVSCPLLSHPSNGMINCSLGDDGVPSYEDSCSFTCNTGYVLTSGDTRTCQSNGYWSNGFSMCRKGKIVSVFILSYCNSAI